MKKWYRSGWIKGFAILWSYLMMITVVFGCVVLLWMGRTGVTLENDSDFKASQNFRNLVFDNGERIARELRSKIARDTLKEQDASVTMDVGSFYYGTDRSVTNAMNPSSEEKTGFAYSVKDLYEWAKVWNSGYKSGYGSPILKCQRSDGTYHYYYFQEFIHGIETGTIVCELNQEVKQIYFGFGDEKGLAERSESEIEGFLINAAYNRSDIGSVIDKSSSNNERYDACWVMGEFNAEVLNDVAEYGEAYSPEGYAGILDFLNKNEAWNDRLESAYAALSNVLTEIHFYTEEYYEYLSAYEEGKTNVTYLYADMDNEKVYTNKKTYENYNMLEKNLKEMQKDSYIQIRSDKGCETNISEMSENNLLGALEYHADFISDAKQYVCAFQIDTDFSADDKLAGANARYNEFSGKVKPVVAMVGIGIITWILAMLWLTVIAGRRAGDNELHLNGFDRIYTEVAAFLTAGIWFMAFAMGINMFGMEEFRVKWSLVWSAVMGGFTQTLFLIGWLSLVRRIKGKTLWKNSLLRACCKLIYKVLTVVKRWLKKQYNRIMALIYGKDIVLDGLKRISEGELQYKIPLDKVIGKRKIMAEYINNIGAGLDAAVEKTMRSERMKTDLITNVSHDIKTPLTSIINYVDLLKRENFTDPKVQQYLQILDEKSQRLKILAEDVVEASKASSGNINLEMTNLDFVELIHQVLGEFEEKFEEKKLTMMVHFDDETSVIRADGQRMWRVLSNIFGNVVKYAMEGTRVYAEVQNENKKVIFTLKNISSQPLNISAEELTERFIRGDLSRNTEGSGLGLSIAKSLTELQGGEFRICVDGDLFKVTITFETEK